jgi:hypothetical protein
VNSLDLSYAISKSLKKMYPDVEIPPRLDGPEDQTKLTVTLKGQTFEIDIRSK